ncbi:type I restriction enzyme S subunit [Vibrio crassostreae]|uniref:restriction endonuclease subunit S n=1 Tax=Vibrio crassostreae TaxID=246167 RepID=UPI000F482EC3|nr:restriction endonuclease subunit S [Vibrio crassostreae]ROO64912.1 type I restriction enzyme S subunit [Vibrio crassostreae]ROP02369.1 type I restriction enzyme S subunit [Vibrio crassostreae]RPE87293.1 type I restriction enzyme S subunit [Vibrio crassostreae]RPF11938.1 type I restriction enzyme S subunit [Vibrio crassostreae]
MSKYQAYPEYKDSGVEWLEHVPSCWDVIKIKHLSPVKRGASPRPIDDPKFFDEEGEYAWVRIADVSASETYLEKTTQTMSELGSSLSVKLEPNQLFLSIAGTVGKPCLNKIKACIHDGFVYFPELNIPNKYLFYVFAGEQAYKGLGKMGTQLNLNTDTVGDIKVALPKEYEHISHIVRFLDHETAKIDGLIDKQQQLIKLLKEKRQAVISHAVTKGLNAGAPMKDSGVEWLGEVPEHWVVTRAKYVSNIFVPQRNKPELNDTHGIAWATMEDMKQQYISDTSKYVSFESALAAGSKKLKAGSVIASCVGNFGVTSINKIDVIINQQLQAFQPVNIKAEYLQSIVALSKQYFELIGTAATLVYVNQEGFENLPVLMPPEKEQNEICEYVLGKSTSFDLLIEKSVIQTSLLKERRTALISAAVTGKIDVRNWQAPVNQGAQQQEAG